MMKKISYALLGATLLTSVAMASDMTPMPALSPACNFSGFYSGLTFGHASGHASIKVDPLKLDLAVKGMNGGVFLGYGKELGTSRVYLGLEAAYLMSGEKLEVKFSLPNAEAIDAALNAGGDEATVDGVRGAVRAVGLDSTELSLKKKSSIEVAARMGIAMNNAMPYVKAGVVNSQFQLKGSVVSAGAAPAAISEKMRLNGFVVGAGVDLKVSRNMMMGLGYTYTTYKHFTKNARVQDIMPVSHNVMFRLGYAF
ncbi:MAG: outer membrane protein [Alphaproteobacteria bacterium]